MAEIIFFDHVDYSIESIYDKLNKNLIDSDIKLTGKEIEIKFPNEDYVSFMFLDAAISCYAKGVIDEKIQTSQRNISYFIGLNNMLVVLLNFIFYESFDLRAVVLNRIRNKKLDYIALKHNLMTTLKGVNYEVRFFETCLSNMTRVFILKIEIRKLGISYVYDFTGKVSYDDFISEIQLTLDCCREICQASYLDDRYSRNISNTPIYTLVYKREVVGFRVHRSCESYDIDFETARHFGINQFATYHLEGVRVEGDWMNIWTYRSQILKEVNGVLVSSDELQNKYHIVRDMSGKVDELYNIILY